MKKLFTFLLLALLSMMAINVRAEGYSVKTVLPKDVSVKIGTAQQRIEPGKWYFIHTPRIPNEVATQFANAYESISNVGGLVTDRGPENEIWVSETSVIEKLSSENGVSVNDYLANLVRFVATSESDLYKIQFATGRWFDTPETGTAEKTNSEYYFYPIKRNGVPNTAGRFGWNLKNTTKSRVDNNGADHSLAFWGNGFLVAEEMDRYDSSLGDAGIKGNNVWQIYDVIIPGNTEYFETLDEILDAYETLITDNGDLINKLKGNVDVGTQAGNYKRANVDAFLAKHATIEKLVGEAKATGVISITNDYPTNESLNELYASYTYLYNKVVNDKVIASGYYTIRSMVNYNDKQIKGLYVDAKDTLGWNNLRENGQYLWKLEKVDGSDSEYHLINMLYGLSFRGITKDEKTKLTESKTPTLLEYMGNDKAPVTGQKVNSYAIRASHQTDEFSYIHCHSHKSGAGTAGYAVGWEASAQASQWYLEPVDEATAKEWMKIRVNGIAYNFINKNEVKVVSDNYKQTDVAISSTISYNGAEYEVTSIGIEAFCRCENLKTINLPSSLKTLEQGAISRTSITELVIPEGVTSLGMWVADNCPNLNEIHLPSTITNIGEFAFEANSALTSVYSNIPADKLFAINENIFGGVDKNECVLYVPVGAKATYLNTGGWSQFKNINEEITTFCVDNVYYKTITDNKVEVVAPTEGKYCGNITIPATISASWGTTYDVTQIGGNAFYQCTELTGVTLSNNIEKLGYQSFCRCENLKTISLPSSLKTLEQGALSRTGITELVIPEGVTSLGMWVADNCPNLNEIHLPSTITNIGELAFAQNGNLTHVYSDILTGNLREIPANAFEDVDMNSCTLYVHKGAINKYKETAGWNRFTNVSEMIASGYYTIRSMFTFEDGQIKALRMDENGFLSWFGLLETGRYIWKVEHVSGSENEYRLTNMHSGLSFNGITKSQTTMLNNSNTPVVFEFMGNGVAPATGKNVKSYAIRASHQTDEFSYIHCDSHRDGAGAAGYAVGWEASAKASQWYLEPMDEATVKEWMKIRVDGIAYNIINQEEVKVVADDYTQTNITIPATISYEDTEYTVTSIGFEAFCRCENLKAITLPSSLKTLEQGAFSRTGITELRIPKGVTYIGVWVADNCPNLAKVYLPSTITEIGEWAFAQNGKLADVYSEILAKKLFEIHTNVFHEVDMKSCTLHVPSGATNKYKNTAGWNLFKNITDGTNTGIAEFESTETESKPVILDMSGRRIMNPVKGGVYIVNGKKVVF